MQANYCLIEGTCYLNGTSKSGQACAYCDVNNDAFGWTLQTDYCLIDDECYTNGTLNSGDACKFCDVSLDTSDWTDDNETGKCNLSHNPQPMDFTIFQYGQYILSFIGGVK